MSNMEVVGVPCAGRNNDDLDPLPLPLPLHGRTTTTSTRSLPTWRNSDDLG
jgi:hypothetical protein